MEQVPLCSSAQPGVRAAAEKLLVHGQEYLCVLKYSASFAGEDRKSTRLNSSHSQISYAVFCLKKKTYDSFDRCIYDFSDASALLLLSRLALDLTLRWIITLCRRYCAVHPRMPSDSVRLFNAPH